MRTRLVFFLTCLVVIALAACSGPAPNSAPTAAPTVAAPTSAPLPAATEAPAATAEPTAALVTATAEPALPAPTLVAQANEATPLPPAATEIPAAPVAPASELVGSYSAIFPAENSGGRIVALDLAVDGAATMTLHDIGKGAPTVESGTWVQDGDTAHVTFSQKDGAAEDNRISWTKQDGKLISTEFNKELYGEAGLPLSPVGSGEIVSASFGGVTFSFDASLAKSAEGKFLAPVPVEQAPALGGGAPEGVQFTFDNATLPEYFDPTIPQVYVYPVEGLKALDPSVAAGVESLQKMIEAREVPADQQIFVFPLIPANQVFHAQTQYLQFVNGAGFSFVTYYAQDVSPIQPQRVFYTFQGITVDGEYYVSAFWPVTTPAIPAPPENMSAEMYDKFAKDYTAYLAALVKTLDTMPPAGFSPNLALLNNMAQSISAYPLFPTPTPAAEATGASAEGQGTPTAQGTPAAQAAPVGPGTPEPEPSAQGTAAPQGTAVAAATPAQGAGETHSAEYGGVSFSFANSLAQSAQGTTIPAVAVDTNAPMLGGGSPEHIAFSFDGKAITSDVSPFQPQIRVYPADDLKALDPSVAQEILTLKTMLSTKPATLDQPVPVFPPYNAQQILQPQIKYLNFKDGQGVRFVTFYAQDTAPVTNDGLFYTFQGLSSDGKKYVTAFWPITTDKLPNSYQDAKITDFASWAEKFESYVETTETELDALPPDAFSPSLTPLDEMVESLVVPKE